MRQLIFTIAKSFVKILVSPVITRPIRRVFVVALIKRQETNLKYLRFNALNIGLEFKLSPLKCKQKRSYVSFFR